nr:hypothetical protein CFP56_62033 [Quercus suber]
MECSLSRKKKEGLVCSTKKVKNVSHAGFGEGHSSGLASPNRDGGLWNLNTSFRDKLLGEIPRAFAQAFSFEDGMDDDTESDGEVETLRQGLLAVKIPRELKKRTRKPWASAFIVKVYGRSVGFNFIQARLLALWKPTGRLDCVDLGHGFFLTRLSLGEDYENVLRKGLWFIGDHFLSIRPWEPDFKPVLASVSSIVVWIRLNELPIEYYNAEALQLIGKAIGNVFRVDTFTASETRGRFARLCVQVDVEKPLATVIMIGRLKQQICYEGIQKMCFECGCLGHRKEYCPQDVWQGPLNSEAGLKKATETCSSSRSADVPDKSRYEEGTSDVLRDSEQSTEQADVCEGVYRPWIVVVRRKNGTKPLRSGGTSVRQSSEMSNRNAEYVGKGNSDRVAVLDGLNRESKRKLSPQKFLEKAQFASTVQSIRQEGKYQAQQSPTLMLLSVKGKKGAARKKNINGDQGSAGGVLRSNLIGFNQMSARLVGDDGQRRSSDGKFRFGDVDGVRFNAGARSSRGESEERGFCPNQDVSKAEQNLGVFSTLSSQGSMEGE